ncbi:hypothetical protein [Clostridium tyrobutyricum]|jgi:hypothetical protein|uniref:hypothetical protein n=1 Tax=Clostridium tyrobutyricum TaxID=1519 RepID=UPI0003029678|nr:hypothetical protein [Clostridium tyrobutyricum]MEA5009691.1 hypothetical protein [Clostridium tyrobutyricum]
MTIPYEIKIAINEVLACEEPIEALYTYINNLKFLHDCRFIFFSNKYGNDIPYFLKSQKINNFNIHCLTSCSKMLVIDEETCDEMFRRGKTTYVIDACIALDTQTVSYLKDIFTENATTINEKSRYFVDYLLKNNVNFDYSLYILENSRKLNNKKEIIKTYNNLLACERFKALDIQKYLRNGLISYTKTNDELKLLTDETFFIMNNKIKSSDIVFFENWYYAIRALLLKVSIIELTYSKKGVKYKINLLLEFINNKIGCILEREIAISYLFFLHDKRVERFFKKIKPNCVDIVRHISGMAWDLSHLRYLEQLVATLRPSNARYELYSIITFDYGLQEVLEACPIKKCAIYKGKFIPVFETPLYELIKEIDDLKYFIHSTELVRSATFKNANYKNLISNLEQELTKLIKI